MIHSRHISVALHEMYTWLRVTSADARAPEMATLHANHTMTNGKGWNSKCCMKVLVDECPAKARYIFSFTFCRLESHEKHSGLTFHEDLPCSPCKMLQP